MKTQVHLEVGYEDTLCGTDVMKDGNKLSDINGLLYISYYEEVCEACFNKILSITQAIYTRKLLDDDKYKPQQISHK